MISNPCEDVEDVEYPVTEDRITNLIDWLRTNYVEGVDWDLAPATDATDFRIKVTVHSDSLSTLVILKWC